MPGPQPIVELDHVTFGYPPRHQPVLEDVCLRIEPDDFLGVIGPNGGGKTTLLKIMLGLLKPQRGSVTVLGRNPVEVRSHIGYVPQHAQIDPSVPADVLDIVLMGRLSRSPWGAWFSRAHIDAAMEALRQTGTADLAKRPIGTLSGGQRQRVLIARALASDARVLLLDEPTAGVDADMERGLTDLLHQMNQRLPIVLVSHDISFVSTHLKRVACLNRTMTCHMANEITQDVIGHMYHDHVRAVEHVDECPLSDPGCENHCTPPHPATHGTEATPAHRDSTPEH
jgi:zinc transport system ATP-binding protein